MSQGPEAAHFEHGLVAAWCGGGNVPRWLGWWRTALWQQIPRSLRSKAELWKQSFDTKMKPTIYKHSVENNAANKVLTS